MQKSEPEAGVLYLEVWVDVDVLVVGGSTVLP